MTWITPSKGIVYTAEDMLKQVMELGEKKKGLLNSDELNAIVVCCGG